MAISSISISQDNKVNGSDLLPVHSSLVFLADASFTGAYPLRLLVDVISEGEVLDTFKAIPVSDLLANIRQFAFVANDVIKGLMGSFDDEQQLNESLVYVNDITKTCTLKVYDPDNEEVFDETTVTFIHGASQFGSNPNFDSIYNNEDSFYHGPEGGFVYLYFYNDDENNILTIDSPNLIQDFAQDYDGEIFTDFDGTPFEIYVSV